MPPLYTKLKSTCYIFMLQQSRLHQQRHSLDALPEDELLSKSFPPPPPPSDPLCSTTSFSSEKNNSSNDNDISLAVHLKTYTAGEEKSCLVAADKISTSLVECECVKAKIGKALCADGSPHVWKKFPPARGQKGLLS